MKAQELKSFLWALVTSLFVIYFLPEKFFQWLTLFSVLIIAYRQANYYGSLLINTKSNEEK